MVLIPCGKHTSSLLTVPQNVVAFLPPTSGMTKVAHIYIVRHGETDANREGIIQGQLDYTLNEKGIIQARGLGRAFAQTSFDFAYSSDLQRASVVSTAKFLDHATK